MGNDAAVGAPKASSHTNAGADKPLLCQFVPRLRMFRVLRAKGKALASGGFGLAITETLNTPSNRRGEKQNDKASEDRNDEFPENHRFNQGEEKFKSAKQAPLAAPSITFDYLFVEEVVFLFERGLVECLKEEATDISADGIKTDFHTDQASSANDIAPPSSIDLSQLYQLLPALGVSLPVYFVYAHLRSQDYRVLRHTPQRRKIILEQAAHERDRIGGLQKRQKREEEQEDSSLISGQRDSGDSQRNKNISANISTRQKGFKYRMREASRIAPAPTISTPLQIAWDVFNPNSNFGKTNTGLPDFYVAISFYYSNRTSFDNLRAILINDCHGIALKVATVSDSGAVAMFGVTDFGAPTVEKNGKSS